MEEIKDYYGRSYYVVDVDKNSILKDDDQLYVVHWNLIYSYLFLKNYKSGYILNIECNPDKIIRILFKKDIDALIG